jgi:hypothetical protein
VAFQAHYEYSSGMHDYEYVCWFGRERQKTYWVAKSVQVSVQVTSNDQTCMQASDQMSNCQIVNNRGTEGRDSVPQLRIAAVFALQQSAPKEGFYAGTCRAHA